MTIIFFHFFDRAGILPQSVCLHTNTKPWTAREKRKKASLKPTARPRPLVFFKISTFSLSALLLYQAPARNAGSLLRLPEFLTPRGGAAGRVVLLSGVAAANGDGPGGISGSHRADVRRQGGAGSGCTFGTPWKKANPFPRPWEHTLANSPRSTWEWCGWPRAWGVSGRCWKRLPTMRNSVPK